jgi:uncharacterized protein YggT (Ycf19 family)
LASEQNTMKQHRRTSQNDDAFYHEQTEPMLPDITALIPRSALPRESWISRLMRAIGAFFSFVVKKINQCLSLALTVLLLLLFTRFIFHFFSISSSQFASWMLLLSAPLVAPFNGLLPSLPYAGYSIDVSTLIAIIVYALAVTIARQFLKILASGPG